MGVMYTDTNDTGGALSATSIYVKDVFTMWGLSLPERKGVPEMSEFRNKCKVMQVELIVFYRHLSP